MKINRENVLFVGLMASMVAGFAGLVFVAAEQEKKWSAFKLAHHCKVVQRMRGDVIVGTGFGVMANGKSGMVTTIATTPDKTAWACDDGVTYWR